MTFSQSCVPSQSKDRLPSWLICVLPVYQQACELAGMKRSGAGGGSALRCCGANTRRAAAALATLLRTAAMPPSEPASSVFCAGVLAAAEGQRAPEHMIPGHLSVPQMLKAKGRAGSGVVVLPPLDLALRTLHTGQSAKAYLTEHWHFGVIADTFCPAAGRSTMMFGLPGLMVADATRASPSGAISS